MWFGDALGDIAEPLMPWFAPRRQGGGTALVDDRAVLVAIIFVPAGGCVWRQLPPPLGVSVPTAHRRFCAWAAAGSSTDYTGRFWTGSAMASNPSRSAGCATLRPYSHVSS